MGTRASVAGNSGLGWLDGLKTEGQYQVLLYSWPVRVRNWRVRVDQPLLAADGVPPSGGELPSGKELPVHGELPVRDVLSHESISSSRSLLHMCYSLLLLRVVRGFDEYRTAPC